LPGRSEQSSLSVKVLLLLLLPLSSTLARSASREIRDENVASEDIDSICSIFVPAHAHDSFVGLACRSCTASSSSKGSTGRARRFVISAAHSPPSRLHSALSLFSLQTSSWRPPAEGKHIQVKNTVHKAQPGSGCAQGPYNLITLIRDRDLRTDRQTAVLRRGCRQANTHAIHSNVT
jgi:hypothetical protein